MGILALNLNVLRPIGLAIWGTLLLSAPLSLALAADYADEQAAAVAKCEAIDPREARGGLIFNPDGHRSFYVRSDCFQDAAVQYRDASLCEHVKQRRSLFGSSWGVSARQCREEVEAGLEEDRSELRALKADYADGGIELVDFSVERNGNGRDFDIVPHFKGSSPHGYTLSFSLVVGARDAEFHRSGYYLRGAGDQIRIYVPAEALRAALPGFSLDKAYVVKAVLELSIGRGGPGGRRSEALVESEFPRAVRTQVMTRTVRFADTVFTPYEPK